jgi:hypothetical protein
MEFVSRILEGSIALDLRDALRRSVSSSYRVSQERRARLDAHLDGRTLSSDPPLVTE